MALARENKTLVKMGKRLTWRIEPVIEMPSDISKVHEL